MRNKDNGTANGISVYSGTLRNNSLLLAALVISLMTVSGCTITNGAAIAMGETREPTSPNDIRIYREAPEDYEEIALVAASAGHDFRSREGLLESAFQRLKKEAADVGANAVILTEIDERDAPKTTTSFGSAYASSGGGTASVTGTGVAVQRGDTYTHLRGVAVFVP